MDQPKKEKHTSTKSNHDTNGSDARKCVVKKSTRKCDNMSLDADIMNEAGVGDSLSKVDFKEELMITEMVKEKKKRDRFKGMSETEVLGRLLPDHLAHNLDIVIIGINPGLTAAYVGHHYAGPGNHFWKCLYLAGFIPQPMNAYDDYKLTEFGIGFTNIVARTTRGSADLSRKEIKEGAEVLTEKILKYSPKIAVFNGKGIYEVFSGSKNFSFGKQPDPIPGTSVLPRAVDKVPFYTGLRLLRDHLRGDLPHLDESLVTFPDLELKVAPRKIKLDDDGLKVDQDSLIGSSPVKVKKMGGRKQTVNLDRNTASCTLSNDQLDVTTTITMTHTNNQADVLTTVNDKSASSQNSDGPPLTKRVRAPRKKSGFTCDMPLGVPLPSDSIKQEPIESRKDELAQAACTDEQLFPIKQEIITDDECCFASTSIVENNSVQANDVQYNEISVTHCPSTTVQANVPATTVPVNTQHANRVMVNSGWLPGPVLNAFNSAWTTQDPAVCHNGTAHPSIISRWPQNNNLSPWITATTSPYFSSGQQHLGSTQATNFSTLSGNHYGSNTDIAPSVGDIPYGADSFSALLASSHLPFPVRSWGVNGPPLQPPLDFSCRQLQGTVDFTGPRIDDSNVEDGGGGNIEGGFDRAGGEEDRCRNAVSSLNRFRSSFDRNGSSVSTSSSSSSVREPRGFLP